MSTILFTTICVRDVFIQQYDIISFVKQNTALTTTLITVFSLWFIFGIIRFITLPANDIHYHADFAVFVDGEQLMFENPLYYEEVGSGCTLSEDSKPAERAHLHDQVPSIIHVHDRNVTWGHFFNNIDYSIGEFHLETWENAYTETGDQQVRYILNGNEVQDIKNRVIESQDRLLVDLSSASDQELLERFETVSTEAETYNSQPDPSACSGSNRSTSDTLKEAFFFL